MEEKRREFRVIALILFLAVLNLADLWLTLQYRSIGLMMENNALAEGLVLQNSPWPLILYKGSLLLLASAILLNLRKKALAEVACIALVLVFVALVFEWDQYVDAIVDFHDSLPEEQVERDETLDRIINGDG